MGTEAKNAEKDKGAVDRVLEMVRRPIPDDPDQRVAMIVELRAELAFARTEIALMRIEHTLCDDGLIFH